MTTKTLYVDSRTRIRGSHADFSITLQEAMTLRGARLFVDAIRTTDTNSDGEQQKLLHVFSEWHWGAVCLRPHSGRIHWHHIRC